VQSSIELFDVRGRYPLKTGKILQFDRPVGAKETFDRLMQSCSVSADQCAFVAVLNFDGNPTDLFFVSEQGFETVTGEAPESLEHYKLERNHLPPLSIAEQRNLRAIYRTLNRSDPERFYSDASIIEEMVMESSGVSNGHVRCSNCNLPMSIEKDEDHTCYRCGKKMLCSYCMTSHACKG